jgi:importin subunit beta-1
LVVRQSATHCISKICQKHILALPVDTIHFVISSLMQKFSDPPAIAVLACSAIFMLAESVKQAGGNASSILSQPMLPLMQALFQVSERPDAGESNLRISAMSAASELVNTAPEDVVHIFVELLPVVVHRYEQTHRMPVVSSTEREEKSNLLGLLSSLLMALFMRLPKESVMPHADRVMTLFLESLQSSSCQEEIFLAIGALANLLEEDFVVSICVVYIFILLFLLWLLSLLSSTLVLLQLVMPLLLSSCCFYCITLSDSYLSYCSVCLCTQKYLQALYPFILASLRNIESVSLCTTSMGLLSDVAGAVQGFIQPFCDELVEALFNCLRDASIIRDMKPLVFTCLGDIASAIGGAYEPYLQMTALLLMQASQQQAPPDDDDLIMFIQALRSSILDTYTGIIMGLSDGGRLELFMAFMPNLFQFLSLIAADENKGSTVLRKAVAMVGDIAHFMGSSPDIRNQLRSPFILNILNEGMDSDDPETQDHSRWAQSLYSKLVMQQAN